MTRDLVEQILQETKAVLGSPTRNQQETLEGVRALLSSPVGPDTVARTAHLAYHIGLYVAGPDDRTLSCANKLMALLNLHSPNTSRQEKEAARFIYPTAWDMMSEDD